MAHINTAPPGVQHLKEGVQVVDEQVGSCLMLVFTAADAETARKLTEPAG